MQPVDPWLALSHFGVYQGEPVENVWVLCPFHPDKNPSLTVGLSGYKCWSCGAKGTFLDLLVYYGKIAEEREDFSELDAIMLLCHLRKHPPKPVEKIEINYRLNEEEGIIFSRAYFESLKQPRWDRLHNSFLYRGFEPKTLKHFDVRIDATSYHPYVIPIIQNGLMKGVVARAEKKEIDPKYKYNPGLKKRKIVGGNLVKGEVTIVEGYADMMRCWQNGYENVVSLLGCECSDEQEQIIRQYATSLVIALDNDPAGNAAALKLRKRFEDVSCYRLKIPRQVKDPGAMTKRMFDAAYCGASKM